MLHKYLHLRGNSYHFRWRIPADVCASELERYWNTCSMVRKEKAIETGLITFYHPDGTKFCDIDHKGDDKKEAFASKELLECFRKVIEG